MVKVKIKRDKKGQIHTFYATGHAGAGEFGSDIVCAGISAIMQTALLGLGIYLGLKERLEYTIDDDGWLFCRLPFHLSEEERSKVDTILETMILGLKSIQDEYQNFIAVEEEVE